jgi:hypothetical protein
MDNQPILSLCIPTNGAVQWVLPVLDSIYKQEYDLKKVEVVITDNGKDSQLAGYLKDYDNPNLRYIPTTDEGFLNLVTSLKEGRGLFCKMINHRSVLEPGTIGKMIEVVERYKENQPIIYFSDGNVKGPEFIDCKNLDQFISNLSYWASWSAGIGFWRKDIKNIDSVELDEMFPNASLLLNLRKESRYVIWNKKYEQMGEDAGKGGYDLYETFAVHFLDIMKGLLDGGRISLHTFSIVKNDLFVFLTALYKNEVILPTKHTFVLTNIKNSMKVYYGISGYWHMVVKAYLMITCSFAHSVLSKILKPIFSIFTHKRTD